MHGNSPAPGTAHLEPVERQAHAQRHKRVYQGALSHPTPHTAAAAAAAATKTLSGDGSCRPWPQALPRDRWLVFANIDEFFYFPCDMQRRIAERKTTFCADMEDRVAQSRRAVELREASSTRWADRCEQRLSSHSPACRQAPPIDEQFPVRCRIRQSLRPRGQRPTTQHVKVPESIPYPHGTESIGQRPTTTEKITLFLASPAGRPHRQYKSPHRLFSQYGKLGRCKSTGC